MSDDWCFMNAGMAVTTIEGLGNHIEGYHPIQQQLADNNGTQCGFCSPGMVMNMYSLLQNNPNPTTKEIEDHFDGNICRCTGYRPILDAMNTFASDYDKAKSPCKKSGKEACEKLCKKGGASCGSKKTKEAKSSVVVIHGNNKEEKQKEEVVADEIAIEDLIRKPKPSVRRKEEEVKTFLRTYKAGSLKSQAYGKLWYHPISLSALYQLMNQIPAAERRLLVGNTSTGIYKKDGFTPRVLVDIRDIQELNQYSVDQTNGVTVGSAITISKLIGILEQVQKNMGSSYKVIWYQALIDHLFKVANFQVRNSACWAGNVMLVHNHTNFPSDVFTIMMGANATLLLGNSVTNATKTVSFSSFLSEDMSNQIILSMTIPFASSTYEVLKTFKIALRHENSHALVNAALKMTVTPSNNQIVAPAPVLVFGGIDSHPIRATNTENFLLNRIITDSSTLPTAINVLVNQDLQPVIVSEPGKTQYRLSVASSFFYKYYLGFVPNLPANLVSAAATYERPVSSGSQSYDTNPIEYPASQYMPKLDGIYQTSGEAQYVDDSDHIEGTLYAAMVLSTNANASIAAIDVSEAMKIEGVVDFVSANDIKPGCNSCETNVGVPSSLTEVIFAADQVVYVGQPVGLILAEKQSIANHAAKLVNITYKNIQTPVLTLQDAIQQKSFFPATSPGITPAGPFVVGDVTSAFAESDFVVSDQIYVGPQYHFHMETQQCIVVPEANGKFNVRSSTQWPATVQTVIARVLDIPINQVTVGQKRIGGAYGAKISRATPVAAAAAVAANKHQRPIRLIMDLNTNMESQSKRHPFVCQFKVGFMKTGVINALELVYYDDGGAFYDSVVGTMDMALTTADNAYYFANYSASGVCCRTNLPPNTSMRAPGCFPSIYFVEKIVERCAFELQMDPNDVRQTNFYNDPSQGLPIQKTPYGTPIIYNSLPAVWSQIQQTSDYASRLQAVQQFNQQNRWRKRGISLVPIKYGIEWIGGTYSVSVNVYPDGTILISHGGTEVGQGINTKIAQVLAYELGVDISLITVGSNDTQKAANSLCTGGSITSELCAKGVIDCAAQLKKRLEPLKAVVADKTWTGVVAVAAASGVDLQAHAWTYPIPPITGGGFQYNTYGTSVAEVELDVLTGEIQIVRCDILYDCGQSLNPAIDIGQAVGGFLTGVGYFLTEELVYDKTGKLTSNGTWEYKPPSVKDIPIDLRIDLLKNASCPLGVLGSKASGEPPLCLSVSIYFAATYAIYAARAEIDNTSFFSLAQPCTVDQLQQTCLVDPSQFTI